MKLPFRLVTSLGSIIAGVYAAGLAMPVQAAWTDESNPSILLQSSSAAVNDAQVVVGVGLSTTFTHIAFMATTAGGALALAPLFTSTSGAAWPCAAGAIANAPTATAVIAGACQDKNDVDQGVTWIARSPSLPPTLMQPLPILAGLRLVPDVQTRIDAINQQGRPVGVSISPTGIATPVIWSSTGVPSALNSPLLGSNINCIPEDINDATTPSIIGNCPSGAGGLGESQAVLWSNASAGYTTLPVPSGASYCIGKRINLSGLIMGRCVYNGTGAGTADVYKTVQWGTGGTGPVVLLSINGSTSQRNWPVDMNASGQIAGNHLVAGGDTLPYLWTPSTGPNGIGISALSGGSRAQATAISNNAVVTGCGETNGLTEAFVSHGGATPIPIVSLSSGGNDCATAISQGGNFTAGISEVPGGRGEENDTVIIATP